jgi:CO/xanthine dehydrogenase FAD-binding subunit
VRDLARPDGAKGSGVERGEVLTRILLPPPGGPIIHRKSRTRAAIDYAWLLVAIQRHEDAYRAVVSAVGPQPIELRGSSPEDLAEAAFNAIRPLGTHHLPVPYRRRMVRVQVRRAAEMLGT